ncbi:MAG: enoyl-CoA hydratase [Acidimicrobiia bacterium]|nr:MAG: enoyl-CoA hydratase [Acidimicrobiia bacterium]
MTGRTETRFVIERGRATLTLARPDIRNALTGPEMIQEILLAITEAEDDPEVRVLVIGAEGPAFSAGGNVKDMRDRAGLFAGTPDRIAEGYRRSIQRLTASLLGTDLVTLASVPGPAVGAGFDLVLGCDLRIGSTSARFAHTFVDLGIVPGDGGAWLLPRVVGWQRAAELAFTGRSLDAYEALEAGILLEVVEPEALESRVDELAGVIAAKPAHSVRLAKRLLRHARTMDLDEFLDLSAAFQAIAHHEPAHVEAVERYVAAWEERKRRGK